MKTQLRILLAATGALVVSSCGAAVSEEPAIGRSDVPSGSEHIVEETTVAATIEAFGVAQPVAEATLSTKLMGTITAVLVREGDRVRAGEPLVRIDARDLEARRSQVEAAIAEAEAVYSDAVTQANRFRALFADGAASQAQLDAAETGLARATAAVEQARAAAAELEAIRGYSEIRAPFAGVVTKRFVDPGDFAAPGAPLLTVQDDRRLRIVVHASPATLGTMQPGDTAAATIEGEPAIAIVEGIVPAQAGNMYQINALVENDDARYLPNSTATLSLVQGERTAILIPAAAIHWHGDLAGVYLRDEGGANLRWIRLREGHQRASRSMPETMTEVLSGLRTGDRIIVPASAPGVPVVSSGPAPAPAPATPDRRF
jgi:RND family efflux transporter MFP subunit